MVALNRGPTPLLPLWARWFCRLWSSCKRPLPWARWCQLRAKASRVGERPHPPPLPSGGGIPSGGGGVAARRPEPIYIYIYMYIYIYIYSFFNVVVLYCSPTGASGSCVSWQNLCGRTAGGFAWSSSAFRCQGRGFAYFFCRGGGGGGVVGFDKTNIRLPQRLCWRCLLRSTATIPAE